MVEEGVPKRVAFGVDMGLPAQTRWAEKRKCLECPKSRLALCDGHRRARHCNRPETAYEIQQILQHPMAIFCQFCCQAYMIYWKKIINLF